MKEGIQYKTISAINAIEDQKSFMNIEISKKPNKLLKIQDFESEEPYFFKPTNDNDNNAANADGLKIRLREFLLTPTVFAVVYDSLRFKSELNDHLAMNVLVLIARFISEYAENSRAASTKLDPKATIQYLSLSDFITKLKRVVFNYRETGKEEDEAGFIDNTLNPALFASLLNMKIEPLNHQPKSIINILMNKGQLGQDALHQVSHYVHIDELDNIDKKEKDSKKEQLDQKAIQKQRANKLKEDIMNQYSNIRNQYHFSDSISDSFSLSNSGFIYPIFIFVSNSGFCIDTSVFYR